MASRSAQFLKELQRATAHIPNTPNPAVLPCSGPRLSIGIFFDGTGNERVFQPGQAIRRLLMTNPELRARK
jgi:hypothetical protein